MRGVRGERWALAVGLAALLVAYLLMVRYPQRPDGDLTAVIRFDGQYARGPLHELRDLLALNLAGAIFAWGGVSALLRALVGRRVLPVLLWLALLVAWVGWAWNQTRGWQGELFLEPAVAMSLGPDHRPTLIFERFLLPPAPDGAGRALAQRLVVEGRAYQVTEAAPYRAGGWTVVPRWYGATVQSEALVAPIFFGSDGVQAGERRDGGTVQVRLDMQRLAASSEPPLDDLHAAYYSIVRARFAPGDGLIGAGAALAVLAVGLRLWGVVRAARVKNVLDF